MSCCARCWREKSRNVYKILRVGSPIALQDFLTNLSFLIITAIINTLGVAASAGVGISEKLFVFLAIVPLSFMSALSSFVAQNMGAGNPRRAERALFAAQRISFCFGCGMFLLTFFAGRGLASLFVSDPQVLTAAADYLRGSSFEYLLSAFTFSDMAAYICSISKLISSRNTSNPSAILSASWADMISFLFSAICLPVISINLRYSAFFW